ncbi:MAG: DUF177 domain-containing protein [Kiritimatiellae bacterium]|nr:DUF177 domain-containing protein [Kiritimatiellia bacterium]MDD5520475.1 DUF177 domain-containing protein [Kiritimatiellia bacterium]
MIIRMSEIPPEGMRFLGEEQSSILDLENEKDISVNGPLYYDLYAQVAPGELIVRGSVGVEMSFRCSRCGEVFQTKVKDGAFVAVREAGMDESVDLTEEIREAIILTFPNYPVCKVDCKGLCVQCGVSLNREKCNCRKREENVWTVLDGLKLK